MYGKNPVNLPLVDFRIATDSDQDCIDASILPESDMLYDSCSSISEYFSNDKITDHEYPFDRTDFNERDLFMRAMASYMSARNLGLSEYDMI